MNGPRVSKSAATAAAATAAAIYFHFLLFAEFALLELNAGIRGGAGVSPEHMLPLVVSGIIGATLAAALHRRVGVRQQVAAGLAICTIASVVAATATGAPSITTATALTGLGLGIATVSLAGSADRLFAGRRMGVWLGVATGAAYAACNVPALFASSPRTQSVAAALIAGTGALFVLFADSKHEPAPAATKPTRLFWAGVAVLFALVWFDSAAFFQIQHDEAMKARTWTGSAQLWTIAGVHLATAIISGLLIDAGRIRGTLFAAVALLSVAVIALKVPPGWETTGHILYPAGVSLYSVALIAWPAATRGVSAPAGTPVRAAILYVLSGWIASAAGIGMVADLGRLALLPCIAAGVIALGMLGWRRTWTTALAAGALFLVVPRDARATGGDPIAEGRRVYIAEGCIHCHSQFVRPGTVDELSWGPAPELEHVLAEAPPLFGNRRQGPDLQNVGLRRSAEWNRLHLIEPASVSPGSRMPSYAHLFSIPDRAGDALIAYLESLGEGRREERAAQIAGWAPPGNTSGVKHGRELFEARCIQCHGAEGRGDGPLAQRLVSKPRDLTAGEWRMTPRSDRNALARVIKFGISGTSMPGQETLRDEDIGALTDFVQSLNIHATADENPSG